MMPSERTHSKGLRGKIVKGIAGFYYVHDGISAVYECKARGIFRERGVKPLVGDNVEFDILDAGERTGNITDVLKRENELIRPAVANISQAMLVFAAAEPDPNLNLLDRFLISMQLRDVPVILCFNKSDLAEKEELSRLVNIYTGAGYHVCTVSAKLGDGIGELKAFLKGRTTALAGPSGVGKSSLTNLLQPDAGMETGAVSDKIKRGRHTTRHSELFFVEKDTYLMDTPGFGSLFAEDIEPKDLAACFPEFAPFVPECRFLGCVHVGERDCGVKSAVQEGKIAGSRYENYRLIYNELKHNRRY